MSDDPKVALPDLENGGGLPDAVAGAEPEGPTTRIASDLEAVFAEPLERVGGRARLERAAAKQFRSRLRHARRHAIDLRG